MSTDIIWYVLLASLGVGMVAFVLIAIERRGMQRRASLPLCDVRRIQVHTPSGDVTVKIRWNEQEPT